MDKLFSIEVMLFIFGALLLLTSIIGGGFEIKELKMPRVGAAVRMFSGLAGASFVVLSFGMSPDVAGPDSDAVHDEVVAVLPSDTVELLSSASDSMAYGDYVEVADDTGSIFVELPAHWEHSGDYAGGIVPAVGGAPDLEALPYAWDLPGVVVAASSDWTAMTDLSNALVDDAEEGCAFAGEEPYDDGVYQGSVAAWTECGGLGTAMVIINAVPPEEHFAITVAMQLVSDTDLAAAAKVIETFVVLGAV